MKAITNIILGACAIVIPRAPGIEKVKTENSQFLTETL